MTDSAVLDLATYFAPARDGRPAWRRPGPVVLVVALIGLLALAACAGAGKLPFARWSAPPTSQRIELHLDLGQAKVLADMNVDDTAQIVTTGEDAQARNAAIPLSGQPLEQASRLLVAGDASSNYANALKCLTQAVYYEAATEPMAGRRAVAQVIINRMRHPAFPHSVCGVVYQGAERGSGCQFSFTCDGSLLRTPMRSVWAAAEGVAKDALAGHVETSVGTATHYHADYVLPKWAFTLGKIEQVGRHIFYRFNGSWGASTMFAAAYARTETIPQLDLARLEQRLAARDAAGPVAAPTGMAALAPMASDRHADNDVGGRLDVTKEWRLSIPDPVAASSRYKAALDDEGAAPASAVAAAPAAVAPSGAASPVAAVRAP